MRKFFLAGAVLALTQPASAQTRAETVAKLDSITNEVVASNRVIGMVVAVMRGNDTLLLKPYGKADLEWDVPMAAEAMFEIGSQAKQFTAVMVLQLRDEGKLSLDDDIAKWLPDFDAKGTRCRCAGCSTTPRASTT